MGSMLALFLGADLDWGVEKTFRGRGLSKWLKAGPKQVLSQF